MYNVFVKKKFLSRFLLFIFRFKIFSSDPLPIIINLKFFGNFLDKVMAVSTNSTHPLNLSSLPTNKMLRVLFLIFFFNFIFLI